MADFIVMMSDCFCLSKICLIWLISYLVNLSLCQKSLKAVIGPIQGLSQYRSHAKHYNSMIRASIKVMLVLDSKITSLINLIRAFKLTSNLSLVNPDSLRHYESCFLVSFASFVVIQAALTPINFDYNCSYCHMKVFIWHQSVTLLISVDQGHWIGQTLTFEWGLTRRRPWWWCLHWCSGYWGLIWCFLICLLLGAACKLEVVHLIFRYLTTVFATENFLGSLSMPLTPDAELSRVVGLGKYFMNLIRFNFGQKQLLKASYFGS